MKETLALILLAIALIAFQKCTIKSDVKWKSDKTNLELNYNKSWQLIVPYLDTDTKTHVGLIDKSDHASFIVTISGDVSQEVLSDDDYLSAVKEQMISANTRNRLLKQDKIGFKGKKYHRLIFYMQTKFGEMYSTTYIHRDGTQTTGIQFNYPCNFKESPIKTIPAKFQQLLTDLML